MLGIPLTRLEKRGQGFKSIQKILIMCQGLDLRGQTMGRTTEHLTLGLPVSSLCSLVFVQHYWRTNLKSKINLSWTNPLVEDQRSMHLLSQPKGSGTLGL